MDNLKNEARVDRNKAFHPGLVQEGRNDCANTAAVVVREMEIPHAIEEHGKLLEKLWSRLNFLDERLTPIMHACPPEPERPTLKGTETPLTMVLFAQNESLVAMIEKVETIISRLEI